MPRRVNETLSDRWVRPLKYKLIEHAERNAIYNAAQSGTPLRDSICVVSMFPCSDCTRGIIQSGCQMCISRDIACLERDDPVTVGRWKDDWEISMMMMREAGISLLFLTKEELMSV